MKNRTCSIEGCGRKHKARSMCHRHYYEAKRRGDLPVIMPMYRSAGECFEARTVRDGKTGCLLWEGAKTVDGYGQLGVRGRLVRAHRYAWEQVNGPIPIGEQVDHTCYQRACVEVSHLRLASHSENARNRSGAMSATATGCRNVYINKKGFRAVVTKDGKSHQGGTFPTIEQAAKAAEKLRAELFGEFAGRG